MSILEIQASVQALSRVEKLNLIQFIVSELAMEEKDTMFKNGETYPVWSPYDAMDAAEILHNELKKENITYDE